MKISHRDFRPPRRSRYVAQPLKRRPTLRILLLAAIGIAVYLKFDTVVSSPLFQRLRKPVSMLPAYWQRHRAPAENGTLPIGLSWAPDSGTVQAECASANTDSCLGRWNGLGRQTVGDLRATLSKAASQWDLEAAGGFLARFHRRAGTDLLGSDLTVFELAGLDVRGSRGTVSLNRMPGITGSPLCARERCLEDPHPHAPFARFRHSATAVPETGSGISITGVGAPGAQPPRTYGSEGRAPETVFLSLAGPAARPILRGRILELPTATDREWLKLYHGENVFSYYRGFSRLGPGLKIGSMVGTEDTLGMVAGTDSLAGLEVRIEKDGLMVDPVAYLGLAADSSGTGHAR